MELDVSMAEGGFGGGRSDPLRRQIADTPASTSAPAS